jgi:hypothetical protein
LSGRSTDGTVPSLASPGDTSTWISRLWGIGRNKAGSAYSVFSRIAGSLSTNVMNRMSRYLSRGTPTESGKCWIGNYFGQVHGFVHADERHLFYNRQTVLILLPRPIAF